MKIKIMAALTTLLLAVTLSHPAQARHHRNHHYSHHGHAKTYAQAVRHGSAQGCVFDNSGHSVCGGSEYQASVSLPPAQAVDKQLRSNRRRGPTMDASGNERIVAHPAGCPGTAFCGCGVSVKVFGHPVRNLYLAANWLKYPRAAPAPGMVAARHGHVMYIEAIDANGNAVVYDPNSGGHQTRVHTRSLAGYRVVNPHGA